MSFIRARLALLTVLTLSVHFGAIGLAVSSVCAGSHHDGATTEECHMPAELEAACPMHKGASSSATASIVDPDRTDDARALLQCNCGASPGIDALVGTPGLVVAAQSIPVPVTLPSAVVPFEPAALHTSPQVASPPPR